MKPRPRRKSRAILRGAADPVDGNATALTQARRQMMADLCKTIGSRIRGESPSPPARPQLPTNLSPRMRQSLQRLLAGDSEKQIANHLGLSRHTVHVYVKAIYKRFDVQSRGELLARFVQPGVKL